MLLGYISEVVKDQPLAEQYLISVFNDISDKTDEITGEGVNTWLQLLSLAKSKLIRFFDTMPDCENEVSDIGRYNLGNRFGKMTSEQKQIFCEIYYHGKNISQLSQQLNKSEESIRKILKEAFIILRRSE